MEKVRDQELRRQKDQDVEHWLPHAAKVVINDVIWRFAPPTLTIGQADDIALEWFGKLYELWLEAEKASTP